MGWRFLYRIVAIVPVTLSILFLSIWMFYELPAVRGLDTTYLELGGDREIQHLFWSMSQPDHPASGQSLFYFAFLPVDVPDNYYDIPAPFQTAFRSLSLETNDRDIMEEYAQWMVGVIDPAIPAPSDQEGSHKDLVELFQATSVEKFTEQAATIDSDKLHSLSVEMKKIRPTSSHYSSYRMVWRGKENLFHYYLSGILGWGDPLMTRNDERVGKKVWQVLPWTLSYTLPVIPLVWAGMYWLVLWFHDRERNLWIWDRVFILLYSFPTFIIATLALIFLTSNRFGWLSGLFPFPVFMATNVEGLVPIYQQYFFTMVLPMLLFAIGPMILYFRVFREKIKTVVQTEPAPGYLVHMGMSDHQYRFRYLGRHLYVVSLAVFSNVFVAILSGSLIIEYVFNIPGLGRYFYESIVEFDIAASVFLIFIFSILQQLGHVISDFLIDYFLSSRMERTLLG